MSKNLYCSFCGKTLPEVGMLVRGELITTPEGQVSANICDKCVGACLAAISERAPASFREILNDFSGIIAQRIAEGEEHLDELRTQCDIIEQEIAKDEARFGELRAQRHVIAEIVVGLGKKSEEKPG